MVNLYNSGSALSLLRLDSLIYMHANHEIQYIVFCVLLCIYVIKYFVYLYDEFLREK